MSGECLDRLGGIEHWRLQLNREQAVPALLLRPRNNAAPRGVVLYCHAHGNRFEAGKEELLVGRPALQAPPYGRGADASAAGRRWRSTIGVSASASNRANARSSSDCCGRATTLWGWRVHDTLAALDWLRAQPGFETLPVVTLGLSMGSTMALWAAALDERIAGCIELCCAAEYEALLTSGGFDHHGEYFFVPGLAARLQPGRDRRADRAAAACVVCRPTQSVDPPAGLWRVSIVICGGPTPP